MDFVSDLQLYDYIQSKCCLIAQDYSWARKLVCHLFDGQVTVLAPVVQREDNEDKLNNWSLVYYLTITDVTC